MNKTTKLLETISQEQTKLNSKIQSISKLTQNRLKEQQRICYSNNTPKQFIEKAQNFSQVTSKLNQKSTSSLTKNRLEKMKQEKEKNETKECTFKPTINENSKNLVNTIPIQTRPLPKKVQSTPVPDDIHKEDETTNKIQKPLNPDFYEEKLKWKKEKEMKNLKLNRNRNDPKIIRKAAVPVTNVKKNQIIVGSQGDFQERLETKIKESKVLRKKLDKRLYSVTFKPKIHSRFPNAKPLLYELARPKLA